MITAQQAWMLTASNICDQEDRDLLEEIRKQIIEAAKEGMMDITVSSIGGLQYYLESIGYNIFNCGHDYVINWGNKR